MKLISPRNAKRTSELLRSLTQQFLQQFVLVSHDGLSLLGEFGLISNLFEERPNGLDDQTISAGLTNPGHELNLGSEIRRKSYRSLFQHSTNLSLYRITFQ